MKSIKPHIYLSILITIFCLLIGTIFQFIPFGNESLLTIDLGQQYIDFFAYYKKSLENFDSIQIYSLQKGLGGEMIGLWSYYLLSPFNLIFLFFQETDFDLAMSLITYLKILAMGNAFLFYIQSKYKFKAIASLIYSLAYCFMAYTLVYLLNLMWLDALIWLPIISLGLHKIVAYNKFLLYTLSLAAIMISNYYIAYMISIFLIFYAVFQIIENNNQISFKAFMNKYFKFILASILSVMIAAFVLLPTISSLKGNKIANSDIEFSINKVYNLTDILSKLFIGSFHFDEISNGSANIYVSLFVVIYSSLYFFHKKFYWKEKGIAFLILIFFTTSFQYDFLDKFWHGGQFPIWYDYRFSFLFVFFVLELSFKTYVYRPYKLKNWQVISLITIFISFIIYYIYLDNYDYLSPVKLLINLIFFLAYLISLQIDLQNLSRQILLLTLVCLELGINTLFTLSQFSYVDHRRFQSYTHLLETIIEPIRPQEEFYRIHKTFNRTKNEAFFANYFGLNHFSSTIEDNTIRLYGYLGQADGSGFVAYSHGSIFLDDFFSIKYLIDLTDNANKFVPEEEYQLYRSSSDIDMAYYPIIDKQNKYQVYFNEDAFSLGIEVSPDLIETEFYRHQPIENQNLLINLIDFKNMLSGNLYEEIEFVATDYYLVDIVNIQGDSYYSYKNRAYQDDNNPGQAYIEKTLFLDSNHPYYLTLPSQYSNKNVALSIDDIELTFYSPYRSRQIYPIAFNQAQQVKRFKIQLLEEDLTANLVKLYRFDINRYEYILEEYKKYNFNISSITGNSIEGTIDIQQDQAFVLMSLPYDPAWKVQVNDESTQILAVLNETLIAIPVSKGINKIKLIYQPENLKYGFLTSLIGIIIVFGLQYRRYQK